jgi:hypothetical protein
MMTPQLKAGYIEDTLLDPHAANNDLPGKQVAYAGILGPLAKAIVTHYQGQAKDPRAMVPAVVDQAQVFYQHSAATASASYNLWGQVPVKSDGPVVHYYNLTPMGVTHSGIKGVALWYRNFIAPTLGDQAPLVQELQLSGQVDNASLGATRFVTASAGRGETGTHQAALARSDRTYGPEQIVQSNRPGFSGTAAPGSVVKLYMGPAAKPSAIFPAGRATADTNGQWSLLASRPLPNGQYRALVTAFSRALATRPGLTIVPTQPLGRVVVAAPTAS